MSTLLLMVTQNSVVEEFESVTDVTKWVVFWIFFLIFKNSWKNVSLICIGVYVAGSNQLYYTVLPVSKRVICSKVLIFTYSNIQ